MPARSLMASVKMTYPLGIGSALHGRPQFAARAIVGAVLAMARTAVMGAAGSSAHRDRALGATAGGGAHCRLELGRDLGRLDHAVAVVGQGENLRAERAADPMPTAAVVVDRDLHRVPILHRAASRPA